MNRGHKGVKWKAWKYTLIHRQVWQRWLLKNQQRHYVFDFVFLINLFWLHWVFIAVCGLSLVATVGGYSSLQCVGFLLQWLLLLRSTGSRCIGFSSCGTWAKELWLRGLVAPWHVGSSRHRARTHVPCIGRRILNHCATSKVFRKYFGGNWICICGK